MEKVNTADPAKLIIIRGPSGSGKSTIAAYIRDKISGVALIEQDYLSEIVYAHRPGFKEATRDTVIAMTQVALEHDNHVLLDGIFNAKYYESVFMELEKTVGSILYVYLEVAFDETVRCHSTRSKAELFGEEEMREWFERAVPLRNSKEIIIKGDRSAEEVARYIMETAKWI